MHLRSTLNLHWLKDWHMAMNWGAGIHRVQTRVWLRCVLCAWPENLYRVFVVDFCWRKWVWEMQVSWFLDRIAPNSLLKILNHFRSWLCVCISCSLESVTMAWKKPVNWWCSGTHKVLGFRVLSIKAMHFALLGEMMLCVESKLETHCL